MVARSFNQGVRREEWPMVVVVGAASQGIRPTDHPRQAVRPTRKRRKQCRGPSRVVWCGAGAPHAPRATCGAAEETHRGWQSPTAGLGMRGKMFHLRPSRRPVYQYQGKTESRSRSRVPCPWAVPRVRKWSGHLAPPRRPLRSGALGWRYASLGNATPTAPDGPRPPRHNKHGAHSRAAASRGCLASSRSHRHRQARLRTWWTVVDPPAVGGSGKVPWSTGPWSGRGLLGSLATGWLPNEAQYD